MGNCCYGGDDGESRQLIDPQVQAARDKHREERALAAEKRKAMFVVAFTFPPLCEPQLIM
jgi:hypothetical protein